MEKLNYRHKSGFDIIGRNWKNDKGEITAFGFITDGLEELAGCEVAAKVTLLGRMADTSVISISLNEARALAYMVLVDLLNNADDDFIELRTCASSEVGLETGIKTAWGGKAITLTVLKDAYERASGSDLTAFKELEKDLFENSPQFDNGVPFNWAKISVNIVDRGDLTGLQAFCESAKSLVSPQSIVTK